MDVEFLTQLGMLEAGVEGDGSPAALLPGLAAAGWLSNAEAEILADANAFQETLQQVRRVALDSDAPRATMAEPLRRTLVRAVGATDWADLEQRLADLQDRAGRVVGARIGPDD